MSFEHVIMPAPAEAVNPASHAACRSNPGARWTGWLNERGVAAAPARPRPPCRLALHGPASRNLSTCGLISIALERCLGGVPCRDGCWPEASGWFSPAAPPTAKKKVSYRHRRLADSTPAPADIATEPFVADIRRAVRRSASSIPPPRESGASRPGHPLRLVRLIG